MARYKIILAYDGTQFHGSQRQRDVRTVQGVVEETLRKLNWQGTTLLLAGRTDAGVHAAGQVAAFDLDWRHPVDNLRSALNALLPEDVAVSLVEIVAEDFHPRYHALSRSYQYRIYCQETANPLLERYTWRVWPAPDMDVLQAAADQLVGVHDFAAFGSPMHAGGSTIRDLISAKWHQTDGILYFDVTANAFLYHMVRRLVSTQIKVVQGLMDMEQLRSHLHHPAQAIQGLAPACGLTLVNVHYCENS